jgi:cellulose synthase/poly-beta-1,6-N-acetylglucosamine synthase-like glycosyltransferase
LIDQNGPQVSIIVPCYNEQGTIQLLLDAIYEQDYPKSKIKVIIADGLSTDHTRDKISNFVLSHPDLNIRVIDNPKRIIPAGLNRAIESAEGDIIIRLDAHSVPQPDYVTLCVSGLESGMGDNVGGVWDIQPGEDTWQAKSICEAASHKFGVGDASYRYTSEPKIVDTVPFGSFYRTLFDKIGLFDESLLTNEDYEFNVRLVKQGGKVWLDPRIRSVYYSRSSFSALARQYWRYGYWKAQMIRRHPKTLRWRQAVPPFFVLSLVALIFFSFIFPFARILLVIEILLYACLLLTAGIGVCLKTNRVLPLVGVPISILIMHINWGSAFIWGLVKKPETGS